LRNKERRKVVRKKHWTEIERKTKGRKEEEKFFSGQSVQKGLL
jgi:hypothetical protein